MYLHRQVEGGKNTYREIGIPPLCSRTTSLDQTSTGILRAAVLSFIFLESFSNDWWRSILGSRSVGLTPSALFASSKEPSAALVVTNAAVALKNEHLYLEGREENGEQRRVRADGGTKLVYRSKITRAAPVDGNKSPNVCEENHPQPCPRAHAVDHTHALSLQPFNRQHRNARVRIFGRQPLGAARYISRTAKLVAS